MALDLAPYLQAIEDDLQQVVPSDRAPYTGLSDMLRYHLGWQERGGRAVTGHRGKRLRPLLCLLACEAFGGDWHAALPAASALELIHNFTLIHDDIEDNSLTRHQRPTVWSVWGLAHGVNAGDALWALARRSIYRLTERGHSPAATLAAAQLVDETCYALCKGQYLDIASEGDRDMTEGLYERVVRGKTAALTAASLVSGAMLGGATTAYLEQIESFGLELGIAFQLTDDLLGIWGDPGITGKSAASDLASHKMTLPVILALAWERARGESTLYRILGQPPSEEHVPTMLAILDRSGARELVSQRASASQQRMAAYWERLGLKGPAAEELCRLTLGIVGREY
ncbi:MAG: polyprenyl synthetase family protein [Anaerolineae bacterium]